MAMMQARQRQPVCPPHRPARKPRAPHPAGQVRHRIRDMQRLTRNDQCYGRQDQQDSGADARREGLAENRNAEKQRRDGFQRSEDRRRCRADAADRPGHRHQRDDRREQRQRQRIDPQRSARNLLQIDAAPQPHDIDQRAEKQAVESQFLGREVFQRRAVDPHDIDRIGERRHKDQHDARQVERRAVTAPVEQRDARAGQCDRENRREGHPFVEERRHDHRHQHRVDEQQRRGDAGVHEVVALEERQRRHREEDAHPGQRHDVAPRKRKRMTTHEHQRSEHHHCQHITVEEHRIGTQPRAVERQGKERIHAVTGRGNGPEHITAGTFGAHFQNCTCGTRSAPSDASK